MGRFNAHLKYRRGSGTRRFIQDYLYSYQKEHNITLRVLLKTIDKNDKDQQELIWDAKRKIKSFNIGSFDKRIDLGTFQKASYDLEMIYKKHWGRERPR